MFGKGIVFILICVETDNLLQYLANMASKSAGYCRSEASNGEGLLLLCEAQLGNPMYECEHSDSDAARNCEKKVYTP
jgi:Poly(ADP-ribose) polymerase catalytic domain